MLHLDVGRRVAREELEVRVHRACGERDASPVHVIQCASCQNDACSVKKKTFTHRRAAAAPFPRKGVGWDTSIQYDGVTLGIFHLTVSF